MPTRCAFQLCDKPAKGLVRAEYHSISLPKRIGEIPMCTVDADEVGAAIERGIRVYLTAESVVYLGDLDEQLPRRV